MRVTCLIREQPHYRRDAFLAGLRKLGYDIGQHAHPHSRDDLLIIWNRYSTFADRADSWEAQGGTVLVAENGYVGADKNGHQLYALAIHGHNGSGDWPIGAEDRFAKLDIELQPWQNNDSGPFLICGQRGIGSRLMASPPNWHNKAKNELNKYPTKVRLHPGNAPPTTPLGADLAGAKACVIWSSSSGVKALVKGHPVIYDAPYWICQDAAVTLKQFIEQPALLKDDSARLKAMHKMAWAQWTIEEIETGEPFKYLIGVANDR